MCDVERTNGKYQNRAVLIYIYIYIYFYGFREVLSEKLGIEYGGLHLNLIFSTFLDILTC